jgi:hypothetical protein
MGEARVGRRVVVHMPGTTHHEQSAVLVEIMSRLVAKIRFGNGDEILIPFSKLR